MPSPFIATLRAELIAPRFIAELTVSLFAGILSAVVLSELLPQRAGSPPLTGIATSMLLMLLLHTYAFATMGQASASDRAGSGLTAWLKTVSCACLALGGAFATGGIPDEHMVCIVAGYFAGLAALWTALWRLLSLLTARPTFALQTVAVCAVLANCALFWTRNPITAYATESAPWGQTLPDAAMKLSPPLALAAVWHQQASSDGVREAARFDIIRAPLTYDVWIGSYQAVPYPPILPALPRGERPFQPGLLLALALWSLPLLWFADCLAARANK